MSEMSVEEAYQVMQEHCGIEKGDRVKVLRTFEDGELGCSATHNTADCAEVIGKEAVVVSLSPCNISIDCTITGASDRAFMNVPFFCLELVEKARPELPADVSFAKDGMTVGGTFVSKDTIKRNLDL